MDTTHTLKDFFVGNGEFVSDRPNYNFKNLIDDYAPGVVFSSGRIWKDNRRFCLRNLRNFGMGKNLIEQRIHTELNHFIEWIDDHDGKPFDIKKIASAGTGNVISAILFGKRFEYGDEQFRDFLRTIEAGFSAKNHIWRSIHIVKYLPGDPLKVVEIGKMNARADDFVRGEVRARKARYESGVVDDIVSAYLDQWEQEDTHDPNSHSSDAELNRIIMNIFVAGTETSASTLRWLFLYLMRHPDIQARIHEEIDDVIPITRLPNQGDRPNLPILDATLLETQRIADMLPLALPHGASQLFQYKGYAIPKEASLVPNLTSVHTDETIYPEPNEFRPDRFLNGSKKVVRMEQHVPFSLGRRICLGESLAQSELFLFSSALLQRYQLLPPEGCDPPEVSGTLGIGWIPNPYPMRAVRRF